MYPELGCNELFVLVWFYVLGLYLIWKSVWHKERLKQFGSLWLRFVQIYQDGKYYDVVKEEQVFWRALEWLRNVSVRTFTVLAEKFDTWNGNLNIFWEDIEWICVYIHAWHSALSWGRHLHWAEGEKGDQWTDWDPVVSEQQIVWCLAKHVWEQEDTNGGRYWKAGSCLCLYREELDLGEFILSKLLPWNISMVIRSMWYSSSYS